MKILGIRFKNLNSLYGEWSIDFTRPEYASNGIFAITGPTGSGKTTILDAVCIGLYGATPRLGRITKSGNEIMSRQTGECFSEVAFETQTGRYLCFWEQHRARHRADGSLVDTKHEISNLDTGSILENKKSKVTEIVEEKTGMDYDRFTRSILLAQGDFDTFLKAEPEQKSTILEQITGTEIYSLISLRVHERRKSEKEKLDNLKKETEGIQILSNEEEKDAEKQLKETQNQEKTYQSKTGEMNKARVWAEGLVSLKDEIEKLQKEYNKILDEIKSSKPERKKLDTALKAAELNEEYGVLSEIRKSQEEDRKNLLKLEAQLPEIEKSFSELRSKLEKAEHNVASAKNEQNQYIPLIKQTRSLDQKIQEQEKHINNIQSECDEIKNNIEDTNREITAAKEKKDKISLKFEDVSQYINENKQNEWLVSGFGEIEAKISNLSNIRSNINKTISERKEYEKRLEKTAKDLEKQTRKLKSKEKEVNKITSKIESKKTELNSLLHDNDIAWYREKKDQLYKEMALLNKIESLEEERLRLINGEPCPLCGSKEHPYAKDGIPEKSKTEQEIAELENFINKTEKLEKEVHDLEKHFNSITRELTSEGDKTKEITYEKSNLETKLTDINTTLKNQQSESDEIEKSVLEKTKHFGITEIPKGAIDSITKKLKEKQESWKEKNNEYSKLEKELSEINNEINKQNELLKVYSKSLYSKDLQFKDNNERLKEYKKERREIFGDKNTDEEEKRLDKNVAEAENNEKKNRRKYDKALEELNALKTKKLSLNNNLDRRKPELEKMETTFINNLKKHGFSDEKEFLEARLSTGERQRITDKLKTLDNKETTTRIKIEDREKRIEDETAKEVTTLSLEEINSELKESEAELEKIREKTVSLKYKLEENKKSKEKIKEKEEYIKDQETTLELWSKMHDLTGSADGKKFRNFAQGLTFELMISHANNQLKNMSDRYLLVRDEIHPLELNVLDNYQAGEIRTCNNLSGGESFLVSLALALGLSKMASSKVRVDSLFLDEGFGTLDEDALDTALETLSGLQQDGKLIGVISHVPALKERIATRINIIPTSGGKSIVEAPGCKKIN